jgi:hypothetical protein
VKNAQGKRLMEWIEENGWEVLNGNKQGHEEEEWSYIDSRKEIVIDYGIVNEEALESVEEFRIGERVEPDHLPLEISTEETNHEEMGKGRAKEGQKVTIKIGDEQGVEEYRTRLEKVRFEEQDVEKMAVELKEVIEKATTKKEVIIARGAKGTEKKMFLHYFFGSATLCPIKKNVIRNPKARGAK